MYRAAFGNKFNVASSIAVSNILAFSRGISMTFTLQDLKHLEIMAELEERPASPLEEATVVEAVHTPTTLTEKLLTLAAKLRTAGFVHQAESLESTFGMYKKAEQDANLLYRAHSETGDDLLESAHPDGDVEMAPAQDHNGDVETLQSKHKKIIDVVQKSAQINLLEKSSVVRMLRQSLNVKMADNSADERQKEFDDFKVVQLEIYKRVPEIFKSIESKDSLNKLELSDGKGGWGGWNGEASDYIYKIKILLGTAQLDYYGSYIKSGDLEARGHAIYLPDEILKSSARFVEKLDEAAWHFKLDPADHKTIAVAKSGIAALQHLWLAFYNKYISKDTKGAEYHSQFFTPGSLQRMFEKQAKKMRDIKYFITAGMMNDPGVTASEPIKSYLGGLVSMINTCESNFNQIVEKAQKSGGANPTAFSAEDNITPATLKSYITDPTLLSILKFDNLTSFESTLNSLYLKIDAGLKGLINGNKEFDNTRKEILNKLDVTMGGK